MNGSTGALIVTLLVEVPIVTAFYPGTRLRAIALALGVNVLTNSALNRIWFALVPWAGVALVTGEALCFAIEALVYARGIRRDSIDRAIVASATANLESFALGPVVMQLLRA